MKSAMLKAGSVKLTAIERLNWKRAKPIPKASERFTAIATPKLEVFYEDEVKSQREIMMQAVTLVAAECAKVRESIKQSAELLKDHQDVFIEHCKTADRYSEKLIRHCVNTGKLMQI